MEHKINPDFRIKRVTNAFKNQKFLYIFISGLINIIGFVKSFLTLRFYDFADLGLLNICQNFTVSISLLQIGFVTGGYRLFCYKTGSILGRINSAIFYFFFILITSLIVLALISKLFFNYHVGYYLLIFYIITGVLSLYANWVTCKMLAINKIGLLNIGSLIASLVSLLIIFLYKYIGVWAALSTFLTQSLILIVYSYVKVPSIVPRFEFVNFIKFWHKIVSLGIVPYLTTAMGLFNSQLGRWIITFSLGTEILGQTSLVNLYVTLVNVFPAAVTNLFFPTLISKYETGQLKGFKLSLNRYFIILVVYLGFIIVSTLLFAKFFVNLLFPQHLASLKIVYIVLPSLTFLILSNPLIVVLNAIKRFRAIFYGSMFSVIIYVCSLITYLIFFEVTLQGFYLIENISTLCFFIYNCYVLKVFIKKELS